MKNFQFQTVSTYADAISHLSESSQTKFIGGGTSIVDLMRENIEQPEMLINLKDIPGNISLAADNTLVVGASVKNTALASDKRVLELYPFLAEAILSGASGQIRNMATTAGNIMQRTRCYYFYDDQAACNKRKPGTGCDALEGSNRIHAIVGGSEHCIATHPSDMCVALAALNAELLLTSISAERKININDFYLLPSDTPNRETVLKPGEVISEIHIPPLAFAKHSTYKKVRDRASYAFSLVSIAVAIESTGDEISDLRVAFGGIAPKPWRATQLEQAIRGNKCTKELLHDALSFELALAKPRKDNKFKIDLMRHLTFEAFEELLGEELK